MASKNSAGEVLNKMSKLKQYDECFEYKCFFNKKKPSGKINFYVY
jgi:hypothetical protein